MVVGDFNMRIHSTPEPFDSDNPCLRAFPLLANPRLTQEKDDKLDSKSKAFLDLMAAFNLIPTTGRGRGDTGQKSCRMNSSQNTGSRPDHIAMSSELFDSYSL
jgi:hypothetical protein